MNCMFINTDLIFIQIHFFGGGGGILYTHFSIAYNKALPKKFKDFL